MLLFVVVDVKEGEEVEKEAVTEENNRRDAVILVAAVATT